MFQLAPVGLAPNPRKKIDRDVHCDLEAAITIAVDDIAENHLRQKIVYNLKHPDTKALLKSLDAFFVHGLLRGDRCYWCFVEGFIPISEQEQLQRQWDCRRLRPLSIAWLKDSLNRSTLHFQMLAFANPESHRLRAKWYHKNACLRNQKVLENLCTVIERLNLVEFQIETPFVFSTEDVPIALSVPIEESTITPSGSHSNDLDIFSCRIQPVVGSQRFGSYMAPSLTSYSSFHENVNNPHLNALTERLPEIEINLPEGFAEHSYTSNIRDQNYVIDELLANHRKQIHDYFLSKTDTSAVQKEPYGNEPSTSNAHFLLANDTHSKDESMDENPDDEARKIELANVSNNSDALNPFLNDSDVERNELQNSALGTSPKSSEELNADRLTPNNDDTELSDVADDDDVITGIIPVDSGEIVHLAMEIFRDDGELFQDLFQVYLGHSAGQPVLRYMTVTDQFIYFLSMAKTPPRVLSSSVFNGPTTTGAAEMRAGTSAMTARSYTSRSTFESDHYAVKYVVHTTIAISDIAFITVGLDAQVFCIHLKKHKYFPMEKPRVRRDSKLSVSRLKEDASVDDSTQKRRMLAVDSGSRELTKFIVRTLRQTYAMNRSLLRRASPTAEALEDAINRDKSDTLLVFAKSTQLSLVAQRFLKEELKMDDIKILHKSLIYWIDVPREAETRAESVEGYLNVRQVYSKTWVRRNTDWQYSYFYFKGCMLYQFSDSSCKFAQRAYNVREKITQVYEADVKNEDGFIFQLELDEASENSADTGGALQFKCTTQSEMKKWIDNITLVLSLAMEQSIPVACQFFLTDSHAVFAQEGANCTIDGFMRALNTVERKEVVGVYSVHTEYHNALIIEYDDAGGGAFEYLLLRDERELRRLIATFLRDWGITVELNEDTSSRPGAFNRIYRYCAQLSANGDLWMCNHVSAQNK